jgi:hypothetical protein
LVRAVPEIPRSVSTKTNKEMKMPDPEPFKVGDTGAISHQVFTDKGPFFSATIFGGGFIRRTGRGDQCTPVGGPGQDVLYDVTSLATTGADGKIVLKLTDFLCPAEEGALSFQQPVNIVATPNSSKPFFLTVDQALSHVDPIDNFEITVWAWDADGSPAPGVNFYWRCQVQVGIQMY